MNELVPIAIAMIGSAIAIALCIFTRKMIETRKDPSAAIGIFFVICFIFTALSFGSCGKTGSYVPLLSLWVLGVSSIIETLILVSLKGDK